MKNTKTKPVVFKKKWFNPLYFILNDLIKDNSIRAIFVYGGKSSSKTVTICQLLSKQSVIKGDNTIAFRKHSARIPTTLKKSFNLAHDKMYLNPVIERQDRRYLISNQNEKESEIVLTGMDDEEKAKGIESYKYVYLDELNQFEEAEYKQLNLSLRGIEGQKILGSWNPVSAASWVKTKLVDKYNFVDTEYKLPCPESFVKRSTCGKVILIKTTYQDNYWIVGSPDGSYGYRDENLIAEYDALQYTDLNSYNVNVLGEYGVEDPNKLFARDFVKSKHTGKPKYDPLYDLYLTFDLNYDPTCLVIQVKEDKIHVLKEYHKEGDTLPYVLAMVQQDFPGAYVIINGDASGHYSRNLTDRSTSYEIIKSILWLGYHQLHVAKANPSHVRSRDVTGLLLKYFEVLIHVDCVELIMDLESAVVDDNGSLDPWKKANPKRSHWLDALRYHFFAEHSDKVKEIGG